MAYIIHWMIKIEWWSNSLTDVDDSEHDDILFSTTCVTTNTNINKAYSGHMLTVRLMLFD